MSKYTIQFMVWRTTDHSAVFRVCARCSLEGHPSILARIFYPMIDLNWKCWTLGEDKSNEQNLFASAIIILSVLLQAVYLHTRYTGIKAGSRAGSWIQGESENPSF